MVKLGSLLQTHLYLLSKYFIAEIAFRTELSIWLIIDIVPVLVQLAAWISIFGSSPQIQGISLGMIIQYYLMVFFISNLTEAHFEAFRVKQIREGKIDYFLTRPLSYLMDLVISHVGTKLLYVCIAAPFFLFVVWSLSHFVHIAPFSATPLQFGTAILLILIAACLQTMISILIVLMGFWFEGAEGLEHFKWLFVSVLAGTLAPPALLPSWLQTLIRLLPFQYLYTVPISVLQGTRYMSYSDWGYLLIVLVASILGVRTLWHFAKVKYSSAGG